MKLIFIILIVLLSPLHADSTLEKAFQDFAKSFKLKREDKTKALQLSARTFEIALQKHQGRNAMLHYNLGTVYLHLEDFGKSIYHLKMAHAIDPNDSRIVKNLVRAGQSARVDIAQENEQQFSSILLQYWKALGPKQWQAFIVFISWLLALWYFLSGRKTSILIFALVILTLALITTELRSREFAIQKEVVLLNPYNPRNGFNQDYPSILKEDLKAGSTARLLRTQSGWCEILISNEYRGWVPLNQLGIIE